MKVMVLDDNAQILTMLTTMLHNAFGQEACEVVSGRNGQEGLALLNEDAARPDIILTNLRMPRMDGMTFVSEVRHNTAWDNIRLVMMSALASSDIVNQAAEGGAEAFLRKPFTYRDLTATINHILSD